MNETLAVIIVLVIIGITLYGSALVLVKHFWIGVILLIFLTPIFFIWAFIRGLIGKND